MLIYLIVLIGAAWLIQSILGFVQIKHFNQKYAEMKALGRVAIGKRTGKFRAGTVVMFTIDKKNKILKAAKMQGVTVFSKVKPLDGFEGKYLLKISQQDLEKHNKLTRLAIQDALRSYDIIASGGELQVKKGWIDYLMPKKKDMRRG
ncbi:transcriptional regulator [Rossellomorea marisflavi]|jgi:glucitol operon activator protein|uniref:Transcriptional regulator n=1 Tax=Rossellomorea marisflavi TaxID=189381 RepID=A0A5D4RJD3_9BACI|nr:transcriptional regulator GutM [Rossellomorea marisflavi]MBV6684729.1 transcriptional regulator GutM [Bacillus sp. JRC01]TYS51555.1 transcriptional regulator [Rossellomorea marisflavi]